MKLKYLLIFIIPLALYIYISFFCNPIADDFTFSVIIRNQSIWEGTKSLYLGITGRYFSNFLMIINPIAFNQFMIYKLLPIGIIITTYMIIFYFFKVITQNIFKPISYFTSSLIFLLIYLVHMPQLAEGIYWYTGYASYHLSLINFLLYVISILKIQKSKKFKKCIWHFFSVLLLFTTIGFNEVMMVLTLFFLVIINLGCSLY